MEYKVVRRQAGLGSLGQQRLVAIGEWRGGYVAREAKAVLPSACVWVRGEVGHGESNYEDAISSAVRSPDPFQIIQGSWWVRRLSPDSNPIDIQTLPKHKDEQMILQAIGSEVANVHLETNRQAARILKDLSKRKANSLRKSAKHMAGAVEKDWKRYKKL